MGVVEEERRGSYKTFSSAQKTSSQKIVSAEKKSLLGAQFARSGQHNTVCWLRESGCSLQLGCEPRFEIL